MKADLHVHTYHSGFATHLPWLRSRECYATPAQVFDTAKARGMDLVAMTDHDTLDGCLEYLGAHPGARDFIVGEEIECRVPDVSGLRVHLGALGMTERLHRDIQPLRGNVFEAAAFLRQEGVMFAMNHLFFFYRGQLPSGRYARDLLSLAPAVEVRNGAMSAAHNRLIEDLTAAGYGGTPAPVVMAGSDAHTLRWVGTTFTEAPGVTREEYLASIREGRAVVGGCHGGLWRATSEIYSVIVSFWLSLVGLERQDLRPHRRLASALASLALLPAQFVPAIVAVELKRREAQRVGRVRAELFGGRVEHGADFGTPAADAKTGADEGLGVQ